MGGRWTGYAVVALLAATVTVYGAMVLVTLPHLAAIASANGLADPRLFDLRPGGYDLDAAQSLLAALGERGRDEYLMIQQRLDTVFPPLNGLSLFVGLAWVARRLRIPYRLGDFLAGALGLAAAGFDLAENHAVAALLRAAPALDPVMVDQASTLTVCKSVAVSLAMTLLLAGALVVAIRFLWNRRKGAGSHG